jgi:glyoxylase-like metal-dependent hydrolase (beta-lactamase superfamily II)
VEVVNTHGHIDHCGGNYQFSRVLMDPRDRTSAKEFLRQNREHLLEMASEHPLPDIFDRARFLRDTLENTAPLSETARWDLGGISAEVLPLRTHTRGSVGIFCPERKLLVGGDAVSPMACLVFHESCTVPEYLKSLKRLMRTNIAHILSGHCGRLIGKAELQVYYNCAVSIKLEECLRYRDPLFPQYPGKLFPYHGADGDAVILLDPAKLRQKGNINGKKL